jgi:proliferating cell nuclear antigen
MKISINDLQKVDIFTTLFQNLKSMSEMVNISFTPEKMYLQTMDSAKVSILEMVLPNTWFCEYECQIPVTLGVHTTILYKILSARDKSQSINIEYNDDEDRIYFHMSSNDKSIFDRKFETPLIDIESDLMDIPVSDYQAEISLPSANFSLLISQLKGFGETLEIHCSETLIQLVAKAIESGSMTVEIKIDDLSSFAIEEGQEVVLSFGLQYLVSICQYYKVARDIEIKLHMDCPLLIEYHLIDDGIIKYFLAPKIAD